MEWIIALLNGLSYGLLLFMLSSGFTLIFSMMGVLNFAHASFYMVGAYLGLSLSQRVGFWPALLLAPLLVGAFGALFERLVLRRVHRLGHVPELLVTFGLSYLLLEAVQLVWGRSPLQFDPPALLQGAVLTLRQHAHDGTSLIWGAAPAALCQATEASLRLVCSQFPASRGFMMLVALLMLLCLWLLLRCSRIGLVIQAALTQPQMVEALGHDVPRVFMLVFAVGTGLAGLAGVVGGSTFVTEPAMAASVGSVVFVVVVVGGLGSIGGALLASLLIGVMQTLAVAFDVSLLKLAQQSGLPLSGALRQQPLLGLTLSQVAPTLPYLLLVLMLMLRPKGLLGRREG